jgi:hypothetical protein
MAVNLPCDKCSLTETCTECVIYRMKSVKDREQRIENIDPVLNAIG